MNTEKAGEPVFTNIDKVLAEKIISRCKENSKESEPRSRRSVNENHAPKPQVSASIKWIAAAAAFVLLIIFTLSRKSDKNA